MKVEGLYEPVTSTVSYLVWDPSTRDALVIDPVLDYDPVAVRVTTGSVDALIDRVRALGLHVRAALDTHAHADHLSGLQQVKAAFGCPIGIGSAIPVIQRTFASMLAMEASVAADGSDWDILLHDDEERAFGSLRLRAMHTPGHTPACCSYLVGDCLFTGDTMFMPDFGTGRCDFPGGSADALFDSVQRLYQLPGATRVFVGHDYAPGGRPVAWETTIEACRSSNVQLTASTPREDFVSWRSRRDATLALPKLIFPSLQANVRAGRLPDPDALGRRFFSAPITVG